MVLLPEPEGPWIDVSQTARFSSTDRDGELTTRAVILPAGILKEKSFSTVTPGRVGYVKFKLSMSISPSTVDGSPPLLAKGSMRDCRSIKWNSLAAAVAALVKSMKYGASAVKFVAAMMTDMRTLILLM